MNKINGYNPQTGEWNDSLTGDYFWSSSNTQEAAPDVMTPYTWSVLRSGFAHMTMLPGYLPIGNICGRIYNNGSAAATAFKILGQRNSFDASSKELYGVDPNDIDEWHVSLLPTDFQDKVLVVRNVLQIMYNVRKGIRGTKRFINSNPNWCDTQHQHLPKMDQTELMLWSDKVFMPYMVTCFWSMVSPAITQSNIISKLRADLLQIVSPADTVALLSNVSSKDEILASLGIVANLDRLRKGHISRVEYINNYGHRGPHEVELSTPRPAEDPKWIDEQLDSLEYAPVDVDSLLQGQRIRYQNALENLRNSAPTKYDSIQQRLQEAARLTRLREAGRSEGIRAYWVSRAFALQAGNLVGLEDDIFFLEYEEIYRLLAGHDGFTAQIPARKKAYQKFSALPLYPTIIMGRFDPVEWAADPNRRTDIFDSTHSVKKSFTDRQIKGLPSSAGRVEGRVRILESADEGEQLQPGEIMVAVSTNVGWTPIFPRVAAVITDVGAPLSHAAIVARELGIPAVVGCFNATTVLKNGDLVRVDGGQGTVEIVERAA
jgi:phosphohistidine swiveling domain-containing protein